MKKLRIGCRVTAFIFLVIIVSIFVTACNDSAPDVSPSPYTAYNPADNLARGKTYSGSDPYNEDAACQLAFDGDMNTKWSPRDKENTFLEVDFGNKFEINSVLLYLAGTPKYLFMQYFSDGEWFDIYGTFSQYSERINEIQQQRFDFETVKAERLRIRITEGHVSIAELEVYKLDDTELKISYDPINPYVAKDFMDIQKQINLGESLLGDIFPEYKEVSAESAGLNVNFDAAFKNGVWNNMLDERKVFFAELGHEQDENTSWNIRIGLGGQIYSINAGFGEAVPRQSIKLEWIDSVFQTTAVSYTNHNSDQLETTSIVMQAGSYLKEFNLPGETFYSPMLSYYHDAANNSFSTLNWAQQAYSPNVNPADLLVYSNVRDAGEGIIEITNIFTNFGDTVYDDLSVPWGAIRKDVLKDHVVSDASGGYAVKEGDWSQAVKVSATGGWAANCVNASDPNALALGLVFGKNEVKSFDIKEQWSDMIYSYGLNNEDFIQNTVIRFRLLPGETFYYRYYMVIDSLKNVAEKANSLASSVEYGYLMFKEETTGLIPYYLYYDEAGEVTRLVRNAEEGATPVLYTYSKPVPGSVPLYLLRNKETNEQFITTDPYALGSREIFANPYEEDDSKYQKYTNRILYDTAKNKVEFLGMLGYVMQSSEMSGELNYSLLADVLTDRTFFPAEGSLDNMVAVRMPE